MSRGSHALSRCTRVFFSFPEVTEPDRHHDYNAWHQLDHRPENLALPGVLHGERWVRTPECRAASAVDADPVLSAAQYVAMYWFAEPAAASIEEWAELGQTTLEQGRRPELDWTVRRLHGFFRPFGGRVAPGVEISPEALPYRPHRGVVRGGAARRGTERLRPRRPASAALHREHLPAVLARPGVLGTWSFTSRDVTLRERRRGPGAGPSRHRARPAHGGPALVRGRPGRGRRRPARPGRATRAAHGAADPAALDRARRVVLVRLRSVTGVSRAG